MRVSNKKELDEALEYIFSYLKPSTLYGNKGFEYETSVLREQSENWASCKVQLLVFDSSGKEVFKFSSKKQTTDVDRCEDLLNEVCSDFYMILMGHIMVTFSEKEFK